MYHDKVSPENRQNNFLVLKALDCWRKNVDKMYFHANRDKIPISVLFKEESWIQLQGRSDRCSTQGAKALLTIIFVFYYRVSEL